MVTHAVALNYLSCLNTHKPFSRLQRHIYEVHKRCVFWNTLKQVSIFVEELESSQVALIVVIVHERLLDHEWVFDLVLDLVRVCREL